MAVEHLTDANVDGTVMGQSDTEKIGFHGVTPVVRATLVVDGSDAASTQALANNIKAGLIALGLFK